MKSVYVDDDLHRRAKARAALEGRSLREFVEEHVEQGLHERPAAQARPTTIRESAVSYDPGATLVAEGALAAPAAQLGAPPSEEERLVDEERHQQMLDAVFARLWEYLGAEAAAGPPLEIESIRDLVARYQAQQRGVPTLSETVIAMRDES